MNKIQQLSAKMGILSVSCLLVGHGLDVFSKVAWTFRLVNLLKVRPFNIKDA